MTNKILILAIIIVLFYLFSSQLIMAEGYNAREKRSNKPTGNKIWSGADSNSSRSSQIMGLALSSASINFADTSTSTSTSTPYNQNPCRYGSSSSYACSIKNSITDVGSISMNTDGTPSLYVR